MKASLFWLVTNAWAMAVSRAITSSSSILPHFERQLSLTGNGCSNVQWTVDPEALTLTLSWKSAVGAEWTGFGISEFGSMKGADYAIVRAKDDGFVADDRVSTAFEKPELDLLQNVELLYAEYDDQGRMEVVVRRDLQTCDHQDISVEAHKQYVVCASGMTLVDGDISYHGPYRSSGVVNLVVDEETLFERHFQLPEDDGNNSSSVLGDGFVARTPDMDTATTVFPIDIQMNNVTLDPDVQTTYKCRSLTIPFDMNVAAFEAVWKDGTSTSNGGDNPLMHHIGLYRCNDPSQVPEQHQDGSDWDCIDEMPACDIVLEYARGTGIVQVPSGVHIDLGAATYVLLVHYENPYGQTVVADRSGYRVWVEPPSIPSQTKPAQIAVHDALHSSIHIPADPEQKEITLQYLISAEATRDTVPEGGVQVFGGGIHMHERGVRGRVELIREGVHIMDVYNSFSYDFDRQSPSWKRWKLLPGDALIITCVYQPLPDAPVVGGHRTRDEMCMFVVAMMTPDDGVPVYSGAVMGVLVGEGDPFKNSRIGNLNGAIAGSVNYTDYNYLPVPATRDFEPLKSHRKNVCKIAVDDELRVRVLDFTDPALSSQVVIISAYIAVLLLSWRRTASMIGYNSEDLRDKRNTVVYIGQLVFSLIAFPFVLGRLGWLIPRSDTYDAVDIFLYPILRFLLATQSILYLLELFYRIRPRLSLIVHHLLTSITAMLLYWIHHQTYTELALKLALVLILLALTEQPIYLVLILRNLGFQDKYPHVWPRLCYLACGIFIASRIIVCSLIVALLVQTSNPNDITWRVRDESYSEWWDYSGSKNVTPLSVGILVSTLLAAIIVSNLSACFALLQMARKSKKVEQESTKNKIADNV